jgi:hypothetical protein
MKYSIKKKKFWKSSLTLVFKILFLSPVLKHRSKNAYEKQTIKMLIMRKNYCIVEIILKFMIS